jgi:hypothetical protein
MCRVEPTGLTLKGMSQHDCDKNYLDIVLRWPCYGSTLFEVEQSYAANKRLWLAVNVDGISLIARGEKVGPINFAAL